MPNSNINRRVVFKNNVDRTIVFSDTFLNGNTINTGNWTVTDTSDCVTIAQSSGVGLVFTNPHSCNTTIYQNMLQSTRTVSATTSSGASVQANITWTNPTALTSVSGIMLWKDANNYAFLRTDSDTASDIRIQVSKAGVNVYDVINTGVVKGKDFRITFNFTTYAIKFWYKTSNGKWSQIGTTVNYDIAGGSPLYFLIPDLDLTTRTGGDTITIKNSAFYNTDSLSSNAYGDIISQNFTTMANLSNYTVAQPASTISLTGGYLRFNNAGSGGFANYVQYDSYGSSQLSFFKEEIVFIPQNKTASSYGISLGMISTNSSSTVSISAFMALYTPGGGTIQLYKNGSALGSASSALTYNTGDRIKIIFQRLENYFSATAINLTAGGQVSTSTTASSSSTSNTPNTAGKPVIYSNGGIQDIEYLNVSSSDNMLPKTCFVGDSITYCYSASTLRNSYTRLLTYSGTNAYSINASVGAKTQDILNCISEILAIHPSYVVLMIGGNDVSTGVAQATYEANYTSIVNQIKAAGISVIHCKATPRTATNMTTLNNFIATFTGDTVIDTFTPLKDGGTGLNALYDSGDGTHPNDAGHTLISTTIISAVGSIIL